jgi:hypothetical protein
MSCGKKGISSYELSRQLSLRQKTCWAFQRKVLEAMKSDGNNPLDGTIEVDEFFVGGPEEGKTGRGNEKKQQVVMAIQTDGFGIHRCYAKVIESADIFRVHSPPMDLRSKAPKISSVAVAATRPHILFLFLSKFVISQDTFCESF